jgi:hypothetical protein
MPRPNRNAAAMAIKTKAKMPVPVARISMDRHLKKSALAGSKWWFMARLVAARNEDPGDMRVVAGKWPGFAEVIH